MKRKFYTKIAYALLIMILLTSCKSKEKANVENTSNGKEVSQENVDKEKNQILKIENSLWKKKIQELLPCQLRLQRH